jgi:hypothetical protein
VVFSLLSLKGFLLEEKSLHAGIRISLIDPLGVAEFLWRWFAKPYSFHSILTKRKASIKKIPDAETESLNNRNTNRYR